MKDNKNYLERASYTWSNDSIRLIATPSALAKSTFFYMQEAGYFKTEAPYFTERENLDSFLIVYTISGTGYLHYQGESYTLTAGKVFFIHCMEHHYYEASKDESWEFLWLHFHGASAYGYYQEFAKNYHIISPSDLFFWERTLRRIIAIHQKKDFTTELITSNLIVNLLTELLIQSGTQLLSIPVIPDYLRNLMKWLERNYMEIIRLDELAKLHGVSKFHLCKEFKKYIGLTVNEYIIQIRLSKAKELLIYTNTSINEIAFHVGVMNFSHFINLFKDREGTTPLAYRKQWQSK